MSKNFNISPAMVTKIALPNKTEGVILRTLKQSKKPIALKNLCEALDINRLTALYNLKKLKKRGLVILNNTSKSHTWALSLLETTGSLQERIHHSVSILDAYQALHASGSHTIIGIQGKEAIESILDMIGKGQSFGQAHTRQKLRQVIIDAIITDDAIGTIKSLPKKILGSHFGRPTILHSIPNNSFITSLEIISDGKMLVTIDHATKKASISKELAFISTFNALHETLKMTATKRRPDEIYGNL
ncbi:MAG: winged helix DNA-binding protein [Patescibacteria group bacterium]